MEWAQCDRCAKWRRLPAGIKGKMLPKQWFCEMNVWDPRRARCDHPEDDKDASRPGKDTASDDGTHEFQIRAMSHDFVVGSRIEARWAAGIEFFPGESCRAPATRVRSTSSGAPVGRIIAVNAPKAQYRDATYDVLYDDDETELGVPLSLIRAARDTAEPATESSKDDDALAALWRLYCVGKDVCDAAEQRATERWRRL